MAESFDRTISKSATPHLLSFVLGGVMRTRFAFQFCLDMFGTPHTYIVVSPPSHMILFIVLAAAVVSNSSNSWLKTAAVWLCLARARSGGAGAAIEDVSLAVAGLQNVLRVRGC